MSNKINKSIIDLSIFIMLIFPLLNFSLTGCSNYKPAAPSNLQATAVSSSQIDLTWTDNSAYEQSFKIERSEDQSSYTEIATVDTDITTYSDTGLKPDTSYYYRVRAYNILGNSEYSNVAEAKTAPIKMTWEKIIGGTNGDSGNSIQQIKDGGYIIGGGSNGNMWIVKLDSSGNIVMDKKFIYDDVSRAKAIQQTTDQGYIVAGNKGDSLLIVKLDSNGNKEWETIHDSYKEYAKSIQQTSDNGYIVSSVIDLINIIPTYIRIMKLDSGGGIEWEKTFFTGTYELPTENAYAQQTLDGGYIVAGDMFVDYSFDDGAYSQEISDMWIIKLDVNGNQVWQTFYGEMYSYEHACTIKQTKDGNYIVIGQNDLIKLNENGNLLWSKKIGYNNNAIQETKDNGFIIAGSTYSSGNNLPDFWIGKVDSNGNLQWEKTYGGNKDEIAFSIQQTIDGGYIVAGYTKSFGAGMSDMWILKLDENGNL